MSISPKTFITPEQYLEIERKADFKSEYYNGEMLAMPGASLAHARITAAIFGELRQQLRHEPYEVLGSDMRVAVSPGSLYAYPDITVCCGGPQLLEGTMDTLVNPTVIVEVLSPSTEGYDLGQKFELYESIPSFRQYVLAASERIHVEVRTRQSDGRWLLASAGRLEDTIEIESIGCRLALSDVYEKVEFGERGPVIRPVHP